MADTYNAQAFDRGSEIDLHCNLCSKEFSNIAASDTGMTVTTPTGKVLLCYACIRAIKKVKSKMVD